jgi:transposase
VIAPPDLSSLDDAAKDALILALIERLNGLEARISELMAENAALRTRVNDLETKLGLPPKTPDNSSTPPSLGHKASAKETRKAKSKPHAGAHRVLHPNPDRKIDLRVGHCPHCRADVSGVVQDALQAYDRIELPEIRPDVTRVTLYGGVCPCCAGRFKAAAPAGLEPGSPFGPNLRAFVLYLRFTQAISFERLSRLCSDLLGLDISEGTLVNILANSCQTFAKQAGLIRARLLAGTILQSDETSVRVGKKTWWTWVFHHANDACFVIHQNRSRAVVEEFLGEHRPDFWVSDRLASQMGWARIEHQVCLAHLLRDAQFAIDAGDIAFAPGMHALLKKACAIARRRDQLTDATLRSHAYRLDAKLNALLKIAPHGKEGEKLQRMVKKFRRHFFVFVTNRALPPTNNGSERAIRPCVVFRKVTNCFRSEWGAKLYADIRSVLETARRRDIGSLHAIRLTLNGQPLPETG